MEDFGSSKYIQVNMHWRVLFFFFSPELFLLKLKTFVSYIDWIWLLGLEKMAITSSEKSLHNFWKKILKATCILHEGLSIGKTFKWSVTIQLNHLFMKKVHFTMRLSTQRHTLVHIGTHQFTLAHIGTHWYILEHIDTYWYTCDMFLPSSSLMHLFFCCLPLWCIDRWNVAFCMWMPIRRQ